MIYLSALFLIEFIIAFDTNDYYGYSNAVETFNIDTDISFPLVNERLRTSFNGNKSPNILFIAEGTIGDVFPILNFASNLKEYTPWASNIKFMSYMNTKTLVESRGIDFIPLRPHTNSDDFTDYTMNKATNNIPWRIFGRCDYIDTKSYNLEMIQQIRKLATSVNIIISWTLCQKITYLKKYLNNVILIDLKPTHMFDDLNSHLYEKYPVKSLFHSLNDSMHRTPSKRVSSLEYPSILLWTKSLWPNHYSVPKGMVLVGTSQFKNISKTPVVHEGIRSFLDSSKKLIFISFGSFSKYLKDTFHYKICNVINELLVENDNIQIIWQYSKFPNYRYCTGADIYHLNSFIDHDWILPQANVVLHHGGAGTTSAVIAHGIPALIIPCFVIGDQPYFAAMSMINQYGIGLDIETPEKEILESLTKLLSPPESMIDSLNYMKNTVADEDKQHGGIEFVSRYVYSQLESLQPKAKVRSGEKCIKYLQKFKLQNVETGNYCTVQITLFPNIKCDSQASNYSMFTWSREKIHKYNTPKDMELYIGDSALLLSEGFFFRFKSEYQIDLVAELPSEETDYCVRWHDTVRFSKIIIEKSIFPVRNEFSVSLNSNHMFIAKLSGKASAFRMIPYDQ